MNTLPSTIEAENYDYFPIDGQGRTYSDNSEASSDLSYRSGDAVDLSSISGGGFAISDIEAGEWLTYTISTPTLENANISIRYASIAPGATVRFSLNGIDISEEVSIPHGAPASTGATDWQTLVVANDVLLTQGVHQLKVTFGGSSGSLLFDSFSINNTLTPPIAHWRFEEGTGMIANDCSGNNFHGTINNATWTTRPSGGNALSFNGTNANVILPAAAFANLSDEVSFSFWANGDSSLPLRNSAFWAGNSGGERVLNVHLPWVNSQVFFDASDRISNLATESETEGSWVHWTFTKNANTGDMSIYRNGSLWHSESGNTNPIESIATAFIGSQNNASHYPGLIDNFRLYDVALSANSVSELYANSLNSRIVSYTASAGGSIAGIQEQTVDQFSNGCPVTAVPDTNYFFLGWSDGITENPRTDFNITSNLNITANFERVFTDLEDWRFTNFGTSENIGNAANDFDADFDGIPNLIEYATGLNPNDPSSSLVLEITDNSSELQVTFNRIQDPSLTYTLEGSDTLLSNDWDTIFTTDGAEDGPVITSEAAWASFVLDGRYFFRLQVSY